MSPTTLRPTLLTSLRLILALTLWIATGSAHAVKIAEGVFKSKETAIAASGTFEVQSETGKFFLVIKSDFKISEGPDLFFAFNPLISTLVTGSNAKTMALKVDPGLKSLTGTQTYALPDDFDLNKYPTLIVHCWKYDHLYATASVTKIVVTGMAPKIKTKGSQTYSGLNRPSFRHKVNGRRF
jgi:uncharacterized protein YfdQ (DUF2303 family)